MQPGTFFARPKYEGRKPYIFEDLPYPPDWPWQHQVERVETGAVFPLPAASTNGKNGGYCAQQPSVGPAPAVAMGYAPQTIYMTPEQAFAYELGLGASEEELEKQAAELEAQAAALREEARYDIFRDDELIAKAEALEKQAKELRGQAEGSGGVMDTINGVLDTVVKNIPGIAQIFIDKQKAKYAEKVSDAQARVAAARAAQAEAEAKTAALKTMQQQQTPEVAGKPWYTNPLVIAGVLAATAGGVYLATR
jgi:hypothetical protein